MGYLFKIVFTLLASFIHCGNGQQSQTRNVTFIHLFFQAVACSLYVVGFGESISSLIHQDNPWVSRGIAMGVIVLLLGK